MKDTITKVRALISMKSTLIETLRSEVEAVLRLLDARGLKIERLETRIEALEAANQVLSAENQRIKNDPSVQRAWYERLDNDADQINLFLGRLDTKEQGDYDHIDADTDSKLLRRD